MPIDVSQTGYASVLTIEETTGAGPGREPRQLTLYGSGLPLMGSEWSFENQVLTTWYPGNPIEATQQNLGPRELPSVWNGDWRRTMLSRTPCRYRNDEGAESQVVDPVTLREAVELMGRSGMRLRVTWSVFANEGIGSVGSGFNQSKNPVIVREGLIKKASFLYTRHTDIVWNIEFHWASRGGVQDRVINVRRDQDLDAATNQLSANAAAIDFAVNKQIRSFRSTLRKSAVALSLGQLEQIATAPQRALTAFSRQIQQNVSKMKALGELVNKFRSQPAAIQATYINLASNTQSVAINFVDAFGRTPPEANVNKTRVSSLLRGHRYLSDVAEQARLAAESALVLVQQLRPPTLQRGGAPIISVLESQSSRAGDIIAVHIAKAGDTPQRVSMRYYGSGDHGTDILRANKLPLYQPSFVPGAVLIVPVLRNDPSPL